VPKPTWVVLLFLVVPGLVISRQVQS